MRDSDANNARDKSAALLDGLFARPAWRFNVISHLNARDSDSRQDELFRSLLSRNVPATADMLMREYSSYMKREVPNNREAYLVSEFGRFTRHVSRFTHMLSGWFRDESS